jgi:hypothetical protein
MSNGLDFQPTTPFTQFTGVEAFGVWKLGFHPADDYGFLRSFSVNYCISSGASSCSFSSDIARANLNVPGYRYDAASGTIYYTSVLHDTQGQLLYATISRSVEGMFIKK